MAALMVEERQIFYGEMLWDYTREVLILYSVVGSGHFSGSAAWLKVIYEGTFKKNSLLLAVLPEIWFDPAVSL